MEQPFETTFRLSLIARIAASRFELRLRPAEGRVVLAACDTLCRRAVWDAHDAAALRHRGPDTAVNFPTREGQARAVKVSKRAPAGEPRGAGVEGI